MAFPCRSTLGSMTSPATARWASTASRAIAATISVEPSKIRLIRRSRRSCSAGTGRSPRAASDSARSNPRPPRTAPSRRPPARPFHSPHRPVPPRSGCRCARRRPGARTGRDGLHPERGRRNEGELLGNRFVLAHRAFATAPAPGSIPATPSAHTSMRRYTGRGSTAARCWGERDLETEPDPADDVSAGTRTWWKRVTPFSRPRNPMKELRSHGRCRESASRRRR